MNEEKRSLEPGAGAPRPPWPVAGAVAVAVVALFGLEHGAWFTVLLGVGFFLGYAIPRRLPERAWLVWPLRLALFAVSAWGILESDVPSATFLSVEALVGQLFLAEIVVQTWRQSPTGGPRGAGVTVLSAIVFLASCGSLPHATAAWLAPAYFALSTLALREMRARPEAARGHRLDGGGWAWLGVALLAGAGLNALGWAWRAELDAWVTRIGRQVLGEAVGVGFADAPSLGGGPGTAGDRTRVLLWEGPLPRPHLRGLAFDTYVGGAWHPTPVERAFVAADPARLRPGAPGPRSRVTRLHPRLTLLLAPWERAGLDPGEAALPAIRSTADGALQADFPPPWTYEVIVAEEAPAEEGRPGPEERERLLAVPPEIDPRVRDLARRVAGEAADARARIDAVVRHLLSAHRYSLDILPAPGDPVSSFLLEEKSAHCEYFASAAVILLRCVGVPARYVSGFFAHEFVNPGRRVVRQQDAHAWAEAWIEGTGWVTVEATPGDGRPDVAASAASALLRLREWVEDAWVALRRWAADAPWRALALFAAAGAAGGFLFLRLRLRLRRLDPVRSVTYSSPGPAWERLAARADRVLRRFLPPCPPGRPWAEHLASPAAETPAADAQMRDDLRAWVRAYEFARFGRPHETAAADSLESRLAELERRSP